jgi:phosphoglycolate phosphatase-like HAD superfamily hydrolase
MSEGLLLLFDIDGTLLLQATREHAEGMYAALRRVHRIEIPERRFQMAGMTDRAIARRLLEFAGVPGHAIEAHAETVRRLTIEEFRRRCRPDMGRFVSPGIPEVLGRLASDERMRLSLLTGNFEPVARLKLSRAGIGGFFPEGQGAFGCDHEDRTELPPIARARAAVNGSPWPAERTVIIGDTPRDIACARADGARVVAIATGPYGPDELTDADEVVTSPRDLPDAIAGLR